MRGSTGYGAFANYARSIQAALHCITQAKFSHEFLAVPDSVQMLVFDQRTDPVPLSRRDGLPRLHLEFAQWYRLIESTLPTVNENRFSIRVTGYIYTISDRRGFEVLSYHWHPDAPQGARPEPHLHVKATATTSNDPSLSDIFSTLHLPTEHISVEAIVRLLIEQFGVQPVRRDWEEVIQATEAARRLG